ncbi:MAG: metal-sensitive transcriptional regulator [Chloroflexi bacterium]|nr:metal-sensitive transcriptional regulator [Chloroflexota bacterium]
MKVESPEARDRIRNRLRRIEGQVRGVQRMLDDGRDCQEIVQQLAAIRAAVQQAGLDVMRVYAAQCLSDPTADVEAMVEYLTGTLAKWA